MLYDRDKRHSHSIANALLANIKFRVMLLQFCEHTYCDVIKRKANKPSVLAFVKLPSLDVKLRSSQS